MQDVQFKVCKSVSKSKSQLISVSIFVWRVTACIQNSFKFVVFCLLSVLNQLLPSIKS